MRLTIWSATVTACLTLTAMPAWPGEQLTPLDSMILENLIEVNQVSVDEQARIISFWAKPYLLDNKSYLKEQL